MKQSAAVLSAAAACFFIGLLAAMQSRAHHAEEHTRPFAIRDAGLDQRLKAQVPAHLAFRDESGRAVKLANYFVEKPVLLMPAYFDCPNLCPLVAEGLLRSLRVLPFRIGEDYLVLSVSIDPRDTPERARKKKHEILTRYASSASGHGWHFLTGKKDSIDALANAVGFRYRFNDKENQFAHAAGLIVLTPRGRISRYFYGIEYSPKDLRLSLVEASAGKIGSPVDQLLLFCYRYDPATGKYGLVIMNVMRLAGLGTVVALGGFMLLMFSRERRDPNHS